MRMASRRVRKINAALKIAKRSLRACYSERGVYAGLNQFKELWARDSFFASLGACKLGDLIVVKANLQTFLSFMKKNGQIPLKIGKAHYLIKLAAGAVRFRWLSGFLDRGDNYAQFHDGKIGKPTADQNSLFFVALREYLESSGDLGFVQGFRNKIDLALEWNSSQDRDKDLLIEEGLYCNWADSLKKRGKVLYTNICYYKGLIDASEVYARIGDKERSHYCKRLAGEVKERVNSLFWNGEYYVDWVYKKGKREVFSTDGNLLAIIWGVADKKQGLSIQGCIEKFNIENPPALTRHPEYKSSEVCMILRLLGLGDYHNGMSWLWLGCLDVVARLKLGMKKEALELFSRIADIIVEYGGAYEVYEPDGRPVSRHFYKSEGPFAWSSGLFIWAYHSIKENLEQKQIIGQR